MRYKYSDGGRAAAGFKGLAGDCVTRAVAIASGISYQEVYDALSEGCRNQRIAKYSSARYGVDTNRKWFKQYMDSIGFRWIPIMGIGTGCRIHLRDGELPPIPLVATVSGHYVAVINGVIRDNEDCSREGKRCVYGVWVKKADFEGAKKFFDTILGKGG